MRRPLLGACLLFVILILAFYLCVPYKLPDYSQLEGQSICVSGEVAYIETKESYGATNIIYTLKNVRMDESVADSIGYQHDQIYCYTSEKLERTYIGSKIAVKGDFSSFKGAENPGSFDSQFYYHILGVGGTLKNTRLISTDGAISYLREALYEIRFFFVQKTNQLFQKPYNGIIQAVLLGYKGDLDEEVKQLYKEGGMLHIMTISGMHISMLGMGCYGLLRKLRMPTKFSAFLGAVVVILYGLMIGMQVATFRAVFMFCMKMLAKIRGRTYDAQTALGLSAALLLLKQPMYLFSSGFLLSYGSVLGMVIIAPVLMKLWDCKRPFARKLAGKLMASVGILLATLPIQLYFFYEYSLYSIFINFIVLPLLPYVVGVAVVLLASPLSFRYVVLILVFLDEKILAFYEWICLFFEKMPHHTIVAGAPKLWQILAYYLILALCLFFMADCTKKQVPKRKKYLFTAPILISVACMLLWRAPEGFQCHFLSVGQGDCVVIREGYRTYLVDCGSSSQKQVAENVLLPFFRYYGISKVEGVFLSHGDSDHINGITEWLASYAHSHVEIKSVILPNLKESVLQSEFADVISLCKAQNIPIFTVNSGDVISLGNMQINVLNPQTVSATNGSETDTNEMSQVLLVEYGTARILLTGDISTQTENTLLNSLYGRPITVLKVAHHGSKYSSGAAFLEVAKPQVSVLSFGENNLYGHPHKEVLERLSQENSLILETAKAGCISIYFKADAPFIKIFKTEAIP